MKKVNWREEFGPMSQDEADIYTGKKAGRLKMTKQVKKICKLMKVIRKLQEVNLQNVVKENTSVMIVRSVNQYQRVIM